MSVEGMILVRGDVNDFVGIKKPAVGLPMHPPQPLTQVNHREDVMLRAGLAFTLFMLVYLMLQEYNYHPEPWGAEPYQSTAFGGPEGDGCGYIGANGYVPCTDAIAGKDDVSSGYSGGPE